MAQNSNPESNGALEMAQNSNSKSNGVQEVAQNTNPESNGTLEMAQNSNSKSNGVQEVAQNTNPESNGDLEMAQNLSHEAPKVPEVIVVQRGEWSEFERDESLYCACEDSSLCFTESCPCHIMRSCCTKACLCKDCLNYIEEEDKQKEPSSQYIRERNDVLTVCYCWESACLEYECLCYCSGRCCTKLCQCQGCLNCATVMSDSVIYSNLMHFLQPPPSGENETVDSRWSADLQAINAPVIPQRIPETKWGPSKFCSCKNSECLKFSCECFATSSRCTELCVCQKCHNRIGAEEGIMMARKEVESRDPLAFSPKSITIPKLSGRMSLKGSSSKTYATAMYNRGCACQYPGCRSESCNCFKLRRGCSSDCTCEGCQNLYGFKVPAF
ncbi:putative transcription factor Tesmin family [Dioscorea sansibarensis]